jgi:hypothetical protein
MGERPRHSTRTNAGSKAAATAKPVTTCVSPAAEAALRECEDEAREADDEQRRPAEVEPALVALPGHLMQHEERPCGADEPEGDVEPEDPRPRDRDERSAEHRPDHEADGGDHHVRAHREAELLLRERVGDERTRVREQEGAADSLHDAPHDQLGAAAGEACAQRRE